MTDSQFRVAPNFDFYTEVLLEQADVMFAPKFVSRGTILTKFL